MSQSQANEAYISVRIVTMDHYQGEPIEGLDPFNSDRGWEIRRVPVIRVFGPTPAGQNVCLHLHGIFPYLYVPMPNKEDDGFTYRLSSSIDKAINTSFNQSKSTMQHVYKALKVSGRPFYGYHPRQHNYIKLYFYSYYMLKKASELLANGLILNEVMQPHESHVPFELQFMMDYNLQGMNLIHLKHAVFRQVEIRDEYDELEPFEDLKPVASNRGRRNSEEMSSSGSPRTPSSQSFLFSTPGRKPVEEAKDRFFFLDDLPDYLKSSEDLKKTSTCELEIDAVAADILNSNDLVEGAMNPGLKVLWEDEAERRRILGIEDPLTPPGSPPRDPVVYESSESEKFWMERFDIMLKEKKEREGPRDLSDSLDPDATINIQHSAGSSTYAGETGDTELTHLPPATQLESHVTTLSASVIMEAAAASDNSLLSSSSTQQIGTPKRVLSQKSDDDIEYIVEYSDDSQLEETQVVLEESDEEFIDLLVDLADEEDQGGAAAEQDPDFEDVTGESDNKSKPQSQSQESTSQKSSSSPPESRSQPSPSSPSSQRQSQHQQSSSQQSDDLSFSQRQQQQSQQSDDLPLSQRQQQKQQSQQSDDLPLSQIKSPQGGELLSQTLGLSDSDLFTAEDDLDDEDLVTLEMTQRIWDSEDPLGEEGVEEKKSSQENIEQQQNVGQDARNDAHEDIILPRNVVANQDLDITEEDSNSSKEDGHEVQEFSDPLEKNVDFDNDDDVNIVMDDDSNDDKNDDKVVIEDPKSDDSNDIFDLSVWNIDDDDDENEDNKKNDDHEIHEDRENTQDESILNSSIWNDHDDDELLKSLEISERKSEGD